MSSGVGHLRERFEITVSQSDGEKSNPKEKRTHPKSKKKSKSHCSYFCSKFQNFLINSRFSGIPFAFIYGGYLFYLITYLILSDAETLPLNKSVNISESNSR